MVGRHLVHHPPRQLHLVNDTFRVVKVVKGVLRGGYAYRITLSNDSAKYDAIAGPSTTTVAAGDVLHVRGFILQRQGQPVLVICSAKTVIQFDPEDQ